MQLRELLFVYIFSSATLNCSKKSPVPLLVQKAYTSWKLRISHFHDGAMRKKSSYIGCNAKSFHGWLAKNHLGPRDFKSFHTFMMLNPWLSFNQENPHIEKAKMEKSKSKYIKSILGVVFGGWQEIEDSRKGAENWATWRIIPGRTYY